MGVKEPHHGVKGPHMTVKGLTCRCKERVNFSFPFSVNPFFTPKYKAFHYHMGSFHPVMGPFCPHKPLLGGFGGGLRLLGTGRMSDRPSSCNASLLPLTLVTTIMYNTWLSKPLMCLDVNDANNDGDDDNDDDDSDDDHNDNDDNRRLCTRRHNVRILQS